METAPFGRTGHDSSRVIFGAAALGAMKQDRADRILELLLESGVDHIDTAASYGDSELRVGAWMAQHRDRFFLATKTTERSYTGAKASIEASRRRLNADRIAASLGASIGSDAAARIAGRSVASLVVLRNSPGRASTQCTARWIAAGSRSGSYQE